MNPFDSASVHLKVPANADICNTFVTFVWTLWKRRAISEEHMWG